jgi:hypothetical protein
MVDYQKNKRKLYMDAKKISKFCQPFRIILGTALIGYGVYSKNSWFYLGAIPLVAGIINFCPLCGITKQCNLIGKK